MIIISKCHFVFILQAVLARSLGLRPSPTIIQYIPPDLQPLIPECAKSCVGAYIATTYRPFACSVPPSLYCLCSEYFNSGIALGDAIGSCSEEYCLGDDTQHPASGLVDNACEFKGIKRNKDPQTSTLTTTKMTTTYPTVIDYNPTDTANPQNTLVIATGQSPTTSFATSTRPKTTPVVSWTISSTIIHKAITLTTSPSATPNKNSTSSADDSSVLSPGTIAGITIGGVAAVFLVVLLLGIIASKFRRKRLNRIIEEYKLNRPNRWYSTSDGSKVSFEDEKSNAAGVVTVENSGYTFPFTTTGSQYDYSGMQIDPDAIGVAVSPEDELDGSPENGESEWNNSTATLLPAMPLPVHTTAPAEARAVEVYRPEKPRIITADEPPHNLFEDSSNPNAPIFVRRASSTRKPLGLSSPQEAQPARRNPPRLQIPMSLGSNASFQNEVSRAMSQPESQNTNRLRATTDPNYKSEVSATTATTQFSQSTWSTGRTPVTKAMSYYSKDPSYGDSQLSKSFVESYRQNNSHRREDNSPTLGHHTLVNVQSPNISRNTSKASATTFDSIESSEEMWLERNSTQGVAATDFMSFAVEYPEIPRPSFQE